MTDPYVADQGLARWLSERQASAVYPTGEEVRVGDWVDFGLDPTSIGIDPVEGPWPGRVLEVRATGVLVDTYCNSKAEMAPSELCLMGRGEEAGS